MRISIRHSSFFALLSLILSPPPVVHASPPPADSVHFCAFDDYEQWRGDHPRPAAKRLANLNAGEPRTVRMIYFLPNDWPYRAEVVDEMKRVIKQVQTFYAEQMQAYGYGDKTFRIETDAQGEPLVHRVDGQHAFRHYDNTLGTAVVAELEETFDLDANIYVIVLGTDALRQGDGQLALGVGWQRTKNGGALVMADWFNFFLVAHELGHTFGLYHDFRDDAYVMSYGWKADQLSACAAEFLSVHTYFNPAIPIAEGQPPTAEILSRTRYQPGTRRVPVRVEVSDSEGLHQVSLIGNAKPCRGLAGEKDAVVGFNYDGNYWEDGFSRLSDHPKHHLFIVAVDAKGNASKTHAFLTELSPYEIVTIRGAKDHITSVTFSPDGALLAYGSKAEAHSRDATVVLWDLGTRENTPILNTNWVTYVAFSRDGTLASGSLDGVKLVDVATRKEIASLQEGYGHVAFSRDGTLLASLGGGRAIKLWDVRTRKLLATLEGHTDQINALAFSPDGALLASGSGNGELGDDAVRLWDVASRKEITTLKVPGFGVWSVAFSPDGTILAWGSARGGATLWDVASRKQIAIFEEGGPPVAFSLDGATLAYNSGGGAITLRDVASRKKIISLTGASSDVNLMSLSPDGTVLASGSWWDGTITLWNVSRWMGPSEQEITATEQAIPQTLTKVSGDNQQGLAGEQLAKPFVVSVLDQDDSPLAGMDVTFSVTTGGGLLSSTTDANPCTIESSTSSTTSTTDANGRAATRLTLGSDVGTNTVSATVAGLEPVTFTVTAAEQAMPHSLTKVCGEGQEGTVGILLDEPFGVSVSDEDGAAIAGVVVSFAVTAGGGTLSAATTTTDANGRAATRLTLGSDVGTNTVSATVAGLGSVTFTATGQEDPLVSVLDAFLGGGKLVALPDSPQLAQNAPNPFNSQTVLSYFLPAPGPARLAVFTLTGQRVAVLRQGPQQAGYHRLHWNGRDDAGRPLASGMYLYRLVTDETVLTRKLILLR